MSNENVIEHPEAAFKALKKDVDTYEEYNAKAREVWPAIAQRMAALRETYHSDQEFGAALVLHGIELNKDDRAAFIWMGRLKPEVLEDAMANYPNSSPQHFRRKVESWSDPYYKQTANVLPFKIKIDEDLSKTDPESKTDAGFVNDETAEGFNQNSKNAAKTADKQAPMTIPDSTTTVSAVQQPPSSGPSNPAETPEKRTYARPAKTNEQILREYFCGAAQYSNRIAWLSAPHRALIAQWIRDGILSTPMTKSTSGKKHFTIVALVPELSVSWATSMQLNSNKAQSNAMKRIFTLAPDIFRMRDALGVKIADKQACESWWQDDKRKQAMAQQEASNTSPNTKSANSLALVYLREGQQFGAKQPRPGAMNQKIIVCGEQLWPPTKFCTYSFADVWCAYNLWRQLDGDIARTGDDAESRGRGFMPYSIWLTAASKSFAAAWTAITYAEYQHPDKMLECQCPDQVR